MRYLFLVLVVLLFAAILINEPPIGKAPTISEYKTVGHVIKINGTRVYELTITGPAGPLILVEHSHDLITWEYFFTFIMKGDKTYILTTPMDADKMFFRCSLGR